MPIYCNAGSTIRAGHVREDLAEAARQFYREMTPAELDDLVTVVSEALADSRATRLFYEVDALLSLLTRYSHDR